MRQSEFFSQQMDACWAAAECTSGLLYLLMFTTDVGVVYFRLVFQ